MSKSYTYARLKHPTYPETETLKRQAKQLLAGMGFSEKEIQEEYIIRESNFRVDVVGISESKKVAIELGKCSHKKLFALEYFFDEVIWLPYWYTELGLDSKERADILNQLNKSNIIKKSLEKENAQIRNSLKALYTKILYNIESDLPIEETVSILKQSNLLPIIERHFNLRTPHNPDK